MSSIKLTADSGGGTFEIKAPSSSSNTRVLTLPDTANLTLNGGKILQVKSANKTDYQSTQSGSFVDISGLSVTITPSSSSSKILVHYTIQFAGSNNGYNHARCVFNDNGGSFAVAGPVSDALTANNGDALGGKQLSLDTEDTYAIYKLKESSIQFLHEPSSTNALIYKIQFKVGYQAGSYYSYINRTNDISNDPRTTGISNITVMEVAA